MFDSGASNRMLTERPTSPEEAIEHLLGDPVLQPLVTAHRILEPRPPQHAPWPDGIDPRIVSALRGRGVEALAIPFGFLARREKAVSDPIVDEPGRAMHDAETERLPVE